MEITKKSYYDNSYLALSTVNTLKRELSKYSKVRIYISYVNEIKRSTLTFKNKTSVKTNCDYTAFINTEIEIQCDSVYSNTLGHMYLGVIN